MGPWKGNTHMTDVLLRNKVNIIKKKIFLSPYIYLKKKYCI